MKKILLLFLFIPFIYNCSSEEMVPESETEDIAVISTDYGDMYVLLYDETPKHKENFLKLAEEGFYDSTTFHRVIQGFMIQGGDPNSKDDVPFNDGQGGPGYTIEAEFDTDLYHKKGALAAARLGDQQNPEKRSSGSQFYIVHGQPMPSMQLDQMLQQMNMQAQQTEVQKFLQKPENQELLTRMQGYYQEGNTDSIDVILQEIEPEALANFVPKTYSTEQREVYSNVGGTPFLDGNYTVFGEIIEGLSVVDSIAVVETGEADRPVEEVMMKVRVETFPRDSITAKFGYEFE